MNFEVKGYKNNELMNCSYYKDVRTFKGFIYKLTEMNDEYLPCYFNDLSSCDKIIINIDDKNNL